MVYEFFDKKFSGSGIKNENISNKQLAEELHKPIIRKFNKRKVHSPFIDNVWGADLADMQLPGFYYVDIYKKYAWVIPSKDKKGITINNAFQKILDESNCKPNKIWAEKGSEFYNRSMKSFLQSNDTEMYSAHNEGKSVVTERFIGTLKNKIFKYVTSMSKNVYIDKLDYIVNKYNNTYYRTTKIKPADVKHILNLSAYIESSKKINNQDPRFKFGDIIRISKGYVPNWSEEIFAIKKVKNSVPWTYVIRDLKGEEIVGTFYKRELQEVNQKEFRVEKVIKRKGTKLYVKEKGYHSSFNRWID